MGIIIRMQGHKSHQLSQLNKQGHHAKHAAPQHLAASKHSKGGKKGGLESLTTFATPAGLVSDGIPNGLVGGFGGLGAYPGYGFEGFGYGLGLEAPFGYGFEGAYPYAGYAGLAEPFGAYGFDGVYGAGFPGAVGAYGAYPYAGYAGFW